MNWYSTKPASWSPAVWRSARTFAQTLAASLAVWMSASAVAQSADLTALAYAVVIPAAAAALSAWSNQP